MRSLRNLAVFSALLGMAASLVVTAAAAQEQQAPSATEQKVAEMRQIQQRLISIQKRTEENNPEIRKEREELESMIRNAMREEGYDPDALIKSLESSQSTLQDQSASEKERTQALQQARQTQQELQKAKAEVMQNEEIIQAREAYQSNLMTAMRKEDPEVNKLIERFQTLQRELQQSTRQN